jgi:hypothetical protein
MNIWRMKLRAGDYGYDMWPQCQERAIASMTHPPIYNLNLTHTEKRVVPVDVWTAARSSIWRFAWDIAGGEPNKLVNDIRLHVGRWRHGGHGGVTATTRRLLDYWRDPTRYRKLFFCQIEAL